MARILAVTCGLPSVVYSSVELARRLAACRPSSDLRRSSPQPERSSSITASTFFHSNRAGTSSSLRPMPALAYSRGS